MSLYEVNLVARVGLYIKLSLNVTERRVISSEQIADSHYLIMQMVSAGSLRRRFRPESAKPQRTIGGNRVSIFRYRYQRGQTCLSLIFF